LKDALLIHVDADLTMVWWLATDHLGNGIGLPRRDPLADAAKHAQGRRVVLLVPAEQCGVVEVQTPLRDRARLALALPALVEERLVGDVERQHLTPGPVGGDGRCQVLVVENARVEAWLGAARDAGLDPDSIIPDASCLPTAPVLVCANGRVLLRSAQRAAALAPAAWALAPALLGAQGPVRSLVTPEGATAAAALAAPASAAGIELREEPVSAVELERILLRGVDAALGHDLRHGRYRTARALRERVERWRLPAALGLALLLIALVALATEVGMLLRERRAQGAELAPLLTRVAPEALGQPDPRPYLEARMARRVGVGRQGALLVDLERTVAALRGVGGAQLVGVDARPGALEFAVRAADLTGLEAARAAVEQSLGRAVELRGASSADGHAEARLAVTP
jgi:general secretion pathway protein L